MLLSSFNENRALALSVVCLCVCRVEPGCSRCVPGGRIAFSARPGYRDSDVLHQKKATHKKVQKTFAPFLSFLSNDLHEAVDFSLNLSSCVLFPLRRFLSAASGQSNPVFQSSIPRGGPRLGSAHISPPTLLESSAGQARGPLRPVSAKPQTGALRPCRAAPEVSLPFSLPASRRSVILHRRCMC